MDFMAENTGSGRKSTSINWQNTMTVVSAAILIGAEVFGAAFAGSWAIANLFGLGDDRRARARRHFPPLRRRHHVAIHPLGEARSSRSGPERHSRFTPRNIR